VVALKDDPLEERPFPCAPRPDFGTLGIGLDADRRPSVFRAAWRSQ